MLLAMVLAQSRAQPPTDPDAGRSVPLDLQVGEWDRCPTPPGWKLALVRLASSSIMMRASVKLLLKFSSGKKKGEPAAIEFLLVRIYFLMIFF